MKCKPFASPKDFCKQFLKIFFKNEKDKNTVKAALPILQLVYEVLGSKDFGKQTSKAKGALKDDIEGAVADAEKFKKGKYRKPEKEHIIGLIRKKKKEEERRKKMGIPPDGTGLGDGSGMAMGDDGIPRPPVGPLPGLIATGFTPLHFTPQQLLALKYGPAPHQWKMSNFSSYVSRLPPAFCMDWEEFEKTKTTISTKPTAPYIKIGDVRIDVETGKEYQEIRSGEDGIKVYASMPPNNGQGVGATGHILGGNAGGR